MHVSPTFVTRSRVLLITDIRLICCTDGGTIAAAANKSTDSVNMMKKFGFNGRKNAAYSLLSLPVSSKVDGFIREDWVSFDDHLSQLTRVLYARPVKHTCVHKKGRLYLW